MRKSVAVLILGLVLLAGCRSVPVGHSTPSQKVRKPGDEMEGYYRIPIYDSKNRKQWLYVPKHTNSLILLGVMEN